MSVQVGHSVSQRYEVVEFDTALSVGSGDVPVLATPRLLTWFEQATVHALVGRLADGETSVGTRVEFEHLAASPVGTRITVIATVSTVDERRITFVVRATNATGAIVAEGTILRTVVHRQRFVDRLAPA